MIVLCPIPAIRAASAMPPRSASSTNRSSLTRLSGSVPSSMAAMQAQVIRDAAVAQTPLTKLPLPMITTTTEPIVAAVGGHRVLCYELYIANMGTTPAELTRVEVLAAQTHASLLDQSGPKLMEALHHELKKQPVQTQLLGRDKLTAAEYAPYCELVIAFYEGVRALPFADAVKLELHDVARLHRRDARAGARHDDVARIERVDR